MLDIDDLRGLWRRSLLAYPDGLRDTTTQVRWLQGLTLYADLRQSDIRPSFAGVRCLRDLTATHMAWLSRQEGFAGVLARAGDCFEWRRFLDYQPAAPGVDAGRLWLEDGMMKEEGRDIPYIEHWHREPVEAAPVVGLHLRDELSGAPGVLVVVGTAFMYARGRAAPLPTGTPLWELVSAAGDETVAQDLLDCEISFGAVRGGGWIVERSSLPFKEGQHLVLAGGGRAARHLRVEDQDADGGPLARDWLITSREGDVDQLWPMPELRSATS
ncbi:hypothetical protein [Xanthobacter variabilis]|uniref:hypothetical protein n=1 Tax=Xanthobacter variabilis TaxID=3119932 RepID=UPI003726F495